MTKATRQREWKSVQLSAHLPRRTYAVRLLLPVTVSFFSAAVQAVTAAAVQQAPPRHITQSQSKPAVQKYRRVIRPQSVSSSVSSATPRLQSLSAAVTTSAQAVSALLSVSLLTVFRLSLTRSQRSMTVLTAQSLQSPNHRSVWQLFSMLLTLKSLLSLQAQKTLRQQLLQR